VQQAELEKDVNQSEAKKDVNQSEPKKSLNQSEAEIQPLLQADEPEKETKETKEDLEAKVNEALLEAKQTKTIKHWGPKVTHLVLGRGVRRGVSKGVRDGWSPPALQRLPLKRFGGSFRGGRLAGIEGKAMASTSDTLQGVHGRPLTYAHVLR
jgi:hypothetical protein